jgi:hypothetical protein
MVERPDLPDLESACVGSPLPTVLLLVIAGLFGLPIVGLIDCWHQVSEQGAFVCFLIALFPLPLIWLVFRALTLVHSARTDAQGLEVRYLLRRRFVPWSQIHRVDTRQCSLAGGLVYRIRTTRGVLWLDEHLPDRRAVSAAPLVASIWQHLRRVGQADGMILSPPVASLWMEIPLGLPTGFSLTQLPAGPGLVPAWIMLTMLWMLSGVILFLILKDEAFSGASLSVLAASVGMCALIAAGLRYCDRWTKRVVARSALLAPEGIVARTERRLVVLPWAEITRVRWLCCGHPWMTLLLGASDPGREIAIRCRAEDEATGRFLLALIRQLRANASPPAVVLPLPLRDQLTSLQAPMRLPATDMEVVATRPSGIEAKDRPFG